MTEKKKSGKGLKPAISFKRVPEEEPEDSPALRRRNATSEEARELQEAASAIVEVIEHTTRATREIESLIVCIDGIAEQTEVGMEESRVLILEKEANDLLHILRKKAQTAGDREVTTDRISHSKLPIARKLSRALEILLPKPSDEDFDFGTISLQTPERTQMVHDQMLRAKNRTYRIEDAIECVREELGPELVLVEIRSQNIHAAKTMIEDVDTILQSIHVLQFDYEPGKKREIQLFSEAHLFQEDPSSYPKGPERPKERASSFTTLPSSPPSASYGSDDLEIDFS